MTHKDIERSTTTEGLPVAPSLGPSLAEAGVARHRTAIDRRMLVICALAIVTGALTGLVAQGLIRLIRLIWNFSFYHRLSLQPLAMLNPAPGVGGIFPPIVGGVLVGLLIRFGSRAVAGHGIPEAMEQVLTNQSRIPARMTFLKPLGAAVSIGTGGPFGVEGPIIATGGALGSLIGQWVPTNPTERKILLAAGAAAGIASAFGSPIAAIFLAIELLLFEFRAVSFIPVALASAAATIEHVHFEGAESFFAFAGAPVPVAGTGALTVYACFGIVLGLAAVGLTRAVYFVEHLFEHIPIHYMWKPAIGGLGVGLIGWVLPRTLGPGYFNIAQMISGSGNAVQMTTAVIAALLALKCASWIIALGSGTSGGTLAPVFTMGGALAALLAIGWQHVIPGNLIDVRVAALMGMVAIFAGASRALLTCIVFAFETTHEPNTILPAIVGCVSAYVVAALVMHESMMTVKMLKAGVRVPSEYAADLLSTLNIEHAATPNPVTLRADQTIGEVWQWMGSGIVDAAHHGYPVLDAAGAPLGVITRTDVFAQMTTPGRKLGESIRRPPIVMFADETLRQAVDRMAQQSIGRVLVVERSDPKRLRGILTRRDLFAAYGKHFAATSSQR